MRQILQLLFALCTISALIAILSTGFNDDTKNLYISQMHDRHLGGGLIIGLVGALAVISAILSFLHHRSVGGILRCLIAALLYVIFTTKAYSGEHIAAYLALTLLYSFTALFTTLSVAMAFSAVAALAIPMVLLSVGAAGQLLGSGPEGQKLLLIGFILVECLTIYVCYPHRIAWIDGLDGD